MFGLLLEESSIGGKFEDTENRAKMKCPEYDTSKNLWQKSLNESSTEGKSRDLKRSSSGLILLDNDSSDDDDDTKTKKV